MSNTLHKRRVGSSSISQDAQHTKHNPHGHILPVSGRRTKPGGGMVQSITWDEQLIRPKNSPPNIFSTDRQAVDFDIELDIPHTLKHLYLYMQIRNNDQSNARLPPAPWLLNYYEFKADGGGVTETKYPLDMHQTLATYYTDNQRHNAGVLYAMNSSLTTATYAGVMANGAHNSYDCDSFAFGPINSNTQMVPYVPASAGRDKPVLLPIIDLFSKSDLFMPLMDGKQAPRYTFYFRKDPIVRNDIINFNNANVGTDASWVSGNLQMVDYYLLARGYSYRDSIKDNLMAEYAAMPTTVLGVIQDRQEIKVTGVTTGVEVKDQTPTSIKGDLRSITVHAIPSGLSTLWMYYSDGNAAIPTTFLRFANYTLKNDAGVVVGIQQADAYRIGMLHSLENKPSDSAWFIEKNMYLLKFGTDNVWDPAPGYALGKFRTHGNLRFSFTPSPDILVVIGGTPQTDYDLTFRWERYTELHYENGVVSYQVQ